MGHGVQRNRELHGLVDLARAIPPELSVIRGELREALRELSDSASLSVEFQNHRFSGTDRDRAAAAHWTSKRTGSRPELSRVIQTNGTQSTLLMLINALVGGGGTLLTETTTYPQIGSLASLLGVDVRAVETDSNGILPDALAKACAKYQPKALYVIPTVHNPTTTVTPLDRRYEIAVIARKWDVQVFEDDAQALLPTDEMPSPIASIAPDITWYIHSLSKCISVGLRVGYVISPSPAATDRLLSFWGRMSMWFATPLAASLAARWIETGVGERILQSIRDEMKTRHRFVREVVRLQDYRSIEGALHLWMKPRSQHSPDMFAARAREAGILVRSGQEFVIDPKFEAAGVRVSLTNASRDDFESGILMLKALEDENIP